MPIRATVMCVAAVARAPSAQARRRSPIPVHRGRRPRRRWRPAAGSHGYRHGCRHHHAAHRCDRRARRRDDSRRWRRRRSTSSPASCRASRSGARRRSWCVPGRPPRSTVDAVDCRSHRSRAGHRGVAAGRRDERHQRPGHHAAAHRVAADGPQLSELPAARAGRAAGRSDSRRQPGVALGHELQRHRRRRRHLDRQRLLLRRHQRDRPGHRHVRRQPQHRDHPGAEGDHRRHSRRSSSARPA